MNTGQAISINNNGLHTFTLQLGGAGVVTVQRITGYIMAYFIISLYNS